MVVILPQQQLISAWKVQSLLFSSISQFHQSRKMGTKFLHNAFISCTWKTLSKLILSPQYSTTLSCPLGNNSSQNCSSLGSNTQFLTEYLNVTGSRSFTGSLQDLRQGSQSSRQNSLRPRENSRREQLNLPEDLLTNDARLSQNFQAKHPYKVPGRMASMSPHLYSISVNLLWICSWVLSRNSGLCLWKIIKTLWVDIRNEARLFE